MNLDLAQQFSHYILRIVVFFAAVWLYCLYPTAGLVADLTKFAVSAVMALITAQLVEEVTSRVVARLEHPHIFPRAINLNAPLWKIDSALYDDLFDKSDVATHGFSGEWEADMHFEYRVSSGSVAVDVGFSDGFTNFAYLELTIYLTRHEDDSTDVQLVFLPDATREILDLDFKTRLLLIRERAYSPFINFSLRAKRLWVTTIIKSILGKCEKQYAKSEKERQPEIDLPAVGEELSQEEVDWCVKMAKQGNAEAQFRLACLYEDGKQVETNYDKAEKYYLAAAEQGHTGAQFHLGLFYFPGAGAIRPDERKFFHWTHQAAMNDVRYAMTLMGKFYYEASQHPDPKQAYDWFLKAAEAGCSEGQRRLALMYLRKEASHYGEKNARYWLDQSAAQGDGESMYYLGCMYERGEQVNQDMQQAQRWFVKAVEAGYREAQTKLRQARA